MNPALSFRRLVILPLLIVAAVSGYAQKTAPGKILFRIRPEAVGEIRQLFTPYISQSSSFDPQRCAVSDNNAIRSFLGLPASVSHLQIKPFAAQHSVALESLRERTNPILFDNYIITPQATNLSVLRTSEDKLSRWFELRFDSSISISQIIILLKKNASVECVEPRYLYPISFTPNDPRYTDNEQYAPQEMHAPRAWDFVRCDSTMILADDDIGVDWNHEDLRNAIFINSGETGLDENGNDKRYNGIDDDGDGFIDDWHGWDFGGQYGDIPDNDPGEPTSNDEHGTHTSGIMAARGNNGIGICGVAFGAALLPLKCSADDDEGDVSFGYEGMVYAADIGAKIVNNSWGGTGYSQVGQDVVNYAFAKNCSVVAAAGNYSLLEDLYPASYDHVLAVGAIDETGAYAGFSDYSTRLAVCAPGVNVVSTIPDNGYYPLDGTSMASPDAAGGLALVRQKFPLLNSDQAMERLRVTCRPLTTDPHPGYTGHGIVTLDSAVMIAGPLYSARMSGVATVANLPLAPGTSVPIVLSATSFLDTIKSLKGKIEFVQLSDDTIITSIPQDVDFGDAATLQSVQNLSLMQIAIAPNAPADYVVLFRITFYSEISNYVGDVDYFRLTINPSYLDLDTNNVTVTISGKADIGYNDPPNNNQGNGILWRNAPASISAVGRSVLFQGGLMIGTDENHVVAAAPNENSDLAADQDFVQTERASYISPVDHNAASQEIECVFNDATPLLDEPYTDSLNAAKEVGVTVRNRSYEFTDPAASDAVVMDYLLLRLSNNSNILHTNETAAGLYMDWDIGSSGANNIVAVSPLDSSIVVTRRLDPDYPLVGMKIISEIPRGASTNLYALENDGSAGSIGVYNGFPMSDKWLTLSTPRPTAGPGDVSLVYGLNNIPFESSDSIHLTYIIALATTDAALRAEINRAEQLWDGTASVQTSSEPLAELDCYPNPFNGTLNVRWTGNPDAIITIYDILGRTVLTKLYSGASESLDLSSLPKGAYHLVLKSGGLTLGKEIIGQ